MPGASPPEEMWRRAGAIAARARELGRSLAVPGARLRDIAERVERSIREAGAAPAFPANLSRNEQAAHYTPPVQDGGALEAGDVLKVDVGAHIDGAIADTATTVEVGGSARHAGLREAAREAVEAGIAEVRAGARVDAISTAIERTIHAHGFKPVRNLMGHSIERYLLHAGKSIPNVAGLSAERLVEGEYIAIEPFATNGAGSIENGPFGNIVRFRSDPSGQQAELAPLFARFSTLPFTPRWVDAPQRALLQRARRMLQTYPVFVESGGGTVSQAEHTMRVTAEGAEVTTRP
jgi:methionyl aminopeptidase